MMNDPLHGPQLDHTHKHPTFTFLSLVPEIIGQGLTSLLGDPIHCTAVEEGISKSPAFHMLFCLMSGQINLFCARILCTWVFCIWFQHLLHTCLWTSQTKISLDRVKKVNEMLSGYGGKGSKAQDPLWSHSKFEASLGRTCLKNNENKANQEVEWTFA